MHRQKVDPPCRKQIGFRERAERVRCSITQTVYTPDMILYLCYMGGYTITLQNRIQNGPLFGVSRFRYEEYLEWGIYLGLLSIHIRYF